MWSALRVTPSPVTDYALGHPYLVRCFQASLSTFTVPMPLVFYEDNRSIVLFVIRRLLTDSLFVVPLQVRC